MRSFLEVTIDAIREKYPSLEDLVFILPSKRAGTFLKSILAKKNHGPLFCPEIHSIESFVENMASLESATFSQQLFGLYEAYLQCDYPKKDDFHEFNKWGSVLLQDFNEIDRYLIDPKQLFSNLADVQKLDHWSLDAEKTPMMRDHLQFWEGLDKLYTLFNASLLENGIGHQGLIYRQAVAKLEDYLASNGTKTHIFIGFNALNLAESKIIQRILSTTKADIYWDLDTYFLEDPIHDAGLFIRAHLKSWQYFKKNPVQGISNHYCSQKKIKITGVPKNVSQAKYVGKLLEQLNKNNPEQLKDTAVVLGDESLLTPLLHAVPREIATANITMGYPLRNTVLASFFLQLFELHLHKSEQGWFYKQVLDVLGHPSIQTLFMEASEDIPKYISEQIRLHNWAYLDSKKIASLAESKQRILELLFPRESPNPKDFLKNSLTLINHLKISLQAIGDGQSMEHLYHFHKLFNQLVELLDRYHFLKDLKALLSVYQEFLSKENLDFKGEPLEGLQIMGMLESRNLDFGTVILTSVNEGILPAGKTDNSFIPFDLKRYFGLPTYKEKDAVYTYHFYRLLQRAKHIFILYNTEPDVLEGGEPSRLIMQLLTDEGKRGEIIENKAVPKIKMSTKPLTTIIKSPDLLELIGQHAVKGFSPTSLTNFIRNPLDFYKKNLLGIREVLEVEENVAANTFGTIVHDTLEDLYRPFVGQYLTIKGLQDLKSRAKEIVQFHFAKSYPGSDVSRGKNLIAYQVILRYISNFLDTEILGLERHEIKILGLETELETQLAVPGVAHPVVLKGKLDRIDEKDGLVRIIDYKTGTTRPSQVEIVDWPSLIREHEYGKAFQLLCYALLYRSSSEREPIMAGIVSFKNLGAGLIPFALKDTKNSRVKQTEITTEVLEIFQSQLQQLICEICNPEIPFVEKVV